MPPSPRRSRKRSPASTRRRSARPRPKPTFGGKPISLPGDPRTVGAGRFERAAGDASAFTYSPEYDGAVLALAASLIGEMKLGRGPAPDMLAVGLSATDYVGHRYGTQGQEMCLQLLSLDRDLGDFFAVLDRAGIDYAVALTADHGGFDIVERAKERLPDAQYVDRGLGADVLGDAIGRSLGIPGKILSGEWAGDIYINSSMSAADRKRVVEEAVRRYRAHPQVEAVFTKEEVAATPLPTASPDKWSLIERVRASFDPQRSGRPVGRAQEGYLALSLDAGAGFGPRHAMGLRPAGADHLLASGNDTRLACRARRNRRSDADAGGDARRPAGRRAGRWQMPRRNPGRGLSGALSISECALFFNRPFRQ